MCSRGTYQLRKLSLFFCDWGGSSQGVRSLLLSKDLESFKQLHPHVDMELILKRNHHPYFLARWINGYTRDVPVRNYSKEQILEQFEHCSNTCTNFHNQVGRSSAEATGKRIVGVKESIQGKWYPNMWGTYPRAQMQVDHIVPEPKIPMVEKGMSYPSPKPQAQHVYDEITRAKRVRAYRGP